MATKSKQKSSSKERGTFLTILLIIMALHGIAAGFFFYGARMDDSIINRPWLVTLMAIHSFANVIAAVGIWKWKMWAWQLYIASSILALAVGLLTMGVMSAFYMILPLAIIGWALRTKWDNFS
jgi:hypothetical protein